MNDPDVEHIHINSDQRLWIRIKGVEHDIQVGKDFFANDRLVRDLKVVAESHGKQLDELQPILDVRFDDGSYLMAVIPPVSPFGVTITLSRAPLPGDV